MFFRHQVLEVSSPAGARVLITSRFSDWGSWTEQVALDVLPIEEAVTFLQNRAGREDDAGARTLAEALGRLPLALEHAAATCRRTQMPFSDYAVKAFHHIAAVPGTVLGIAATGCRWRATGRAKKARHQCLHHRKVRADANARSRPE
jgi:hypothetical protein